MCEDDMRMRFGNGARCYSIGIMGGTFDPVHTGHLYCAEQAKDACGLDAVLFVPAGNPSFKQGKSLAPFSDRIKMCEAATAPNPSFFVSDMESDTHHISYTVDTLRRLREALPNNVSLEFILGTDALSSLHLWHEPEILASLCGFICVGRPPVEPAAAEGENAPATVTSLRRMGFKIREVQAPLLDISSSDIRERIRSGRSIRYMVPDAVYGYICAEGLYAEGGFDVSTGIEADGEGRS